MTLLSFLSHTNSFHPLRLVHGLRLIHILHPPLNPCVTLIKAPSAEVRQPCTEYLLGAQKNSCSWLKAQQPKRWLHQKEQSRGEAITATSMSNIFHASAWDADRDLSLRNSACQGQVQDRAAEGKKLGDDGRVVVRIKWGKAGNCLDRCSVQLMLLLTMPLS